MIKESESAITIALLTLSLTANAEIACPTHQSCPVEQTCQCTVTPSSAFDRYFYWDFPNIDRNQKYTCTFKSFPGSLVFIPQKSSFPSGSSYQCVDCPHFPATILLDTSEMAKEQDILVISYLVPGSDIPTQVIAQCKAN